MSKPTYLHGVTHFLVAVHKYFMCAPKSAQLKSWLVDHNHSHYLLVLNSNFSMNTECPHCQLAFRGEKGLAVHLNWSASCKSASQSLRHQELRLLNVNPAITTTSPNERQHQQSGGTTRRVPMHGGKRGANFLPYRTGSRRRCKYQCSV